jgi:maleylacetate reductase
MIAGREQILYGAYLAAVAFASAGSGLHHTICHVLGGSYNLPHAQTHAVMLPYVLAFNGPAVPEVQKKLASIFGSQSAIDGLGRLYNTVDAPRALADYGMSLDAISEAARQIALAVPPTNPRAAPSAALRQLLRPAVSGDPPKPISDRTP